MWPLALSPADSMRWLALLLDAAAKGLAILTVAACVSLLLRRASAALRHMVWSLAAVSLLVLPVLSLALPQLRLPVLPAWANQAVQAEPSPAERPGPAIAPSTVMPPPYASPAQDPGVGLVDVEPARVAKTGTSHHPQDAAIQSPIPEKRIPASLGDGGPRSSCNLHWSAWALIVWASGTAAMGLPLLLGTVLIWLQTHRARRVTDPVWLSLLAELSGGLGVRRARLLWRPRSQIPITCSVLRPAILLPAEAAEWPADRRRAVLLHELAHVKRRDCLTQMLAALARAAYWFNPLVYLACRALRLERERACDDLVLGAGFKASDYASHLLEIVRTLRSARCPALAAVAMAKKSQFEGRMLAILDPRRNRRALTRLGMLLAALLVAGVVIPLSILKATAADEKGQTTADNSPVPSTEPSADDAREEGITPVLTTVPVGTVKHKYRAQELAFSSDGPTLASCGFEVKLWDARSPGRLRVLNGVVGAGAMTFSADGSVLALVNNGEVQLWGVKDLELLGKLPITRWSPHALAMSSDNRTLAACGSDGIVQLWDYTTRQKLRTLGEKDVGMSDMAFSPDGKFLATLSQNARTDVWNVGTGEKIGTQPGERYSVRGRVRFSPDGKTLAVSTRGMVRLWEPSSGKPPRTVEWPDAINPEMIHKKRYKPSGGGSVPFFPGETGAISPNCQWIASINEDGTVAIWDIRTRQVLQIVAGPRVAEMSGTIEAVEFSPDGKLLATGNFRGEVEIWPVVAQQERRAVAAPQASGQPPATQPGHDAWSQPVNGLQARLAIRRPQVIPGKSVLSTVMELRNVLGGSQPIKLTWIRKDTHFRILDAAGKELVNYGGASDGPVAQKADLVILPGQTASLDVTVRMMGASPDAAGVLDLALGNTLCFTQEGKDCFLQAVLDVPEIKPLAKPEGPTWHGRIELPAVLVPPNPEPIEPARIGPLIEELGRKMLDNAHSMTGDEAERALSLLLEDERVIPWYVKAMDTDSYELKFAALKRLAKLPGDLALEGLKKGMKTQGSDIGYHTTSEGARQSAEAIRLVAARALADSSHPKAKSLLLTMSQDPYPEVRIEVLRTFGKVDTKEALELLEKMAQDSDDRVRAQARGYLDLRKDNPAPQAPSTGSGQAQAAGAGAAKAYRWPEKVQEAWLTGLWMRRRMDKPGPSEPNIYMLLLKADKNWAEIAVWGEPEKPSKAEVISSGPDWEIKVDDALLPESGPVHVVRWTDAAHTQTHGGMPLTHVTGSKLAFTASSGAFIVTEEYDRCGQAVGDSIQKAIQAGGVMIGKVRPQPPSVDWPGRPEAKRVVGVWTSDPASPDGEQIFLTIQADGRWATGLFWGKGEDPPDVKLVRQGPQWRLTEGQGTAVAVYFRGPLRPDGGDPSWTANLHRLTEDQMSLLVRKYDRATPKLAAAIDARVVIPISIFKATAVGEEPKTPSKETTSQPSTEPDQPRGESSTSQPAVPRAGTEPSAPEWGGVEVATRPAGAVEHIGRVEMLAFSPDSRLLASNGYDGVKVWEVSSGRTQRLRPVYVANSMTFSADGTLLAVGNNSGEVQLWDVQRLEPRAKLSVCRISIHAVAMSPDGGTLAACAGDGTVQLWDYRTAQRLRTIGRQGEGMGAMAFSADGARLVTVSRYGRADVWEVATGRKIDTLEGRGGEVFPDVKFSDNGQMIAMTCDGHVILWRFGKGAPPTRVALPDGFDPEKLWEKRRLELVNRDGGYTVSIFLHHPRTVLSSDASLAATGNVDGSIAVWDVKSRTVLQGFMGAKLPYALGGGGIDSVAFSPDGKLLATGTREGKVEIWPVVTQPGRAPAIQPAAFGPVIEKVVYAPSHDRDTFLDLETGTLMVQPEDGAPLETTMSPDTARFFRRARWAKASGADICLPPDDRFDKGVALFGLDMNMAPADAAWDALTPQDVANALKGHEAYMGSEMHFLAGKLPATFLMETREGHLAVVQALALTENPRGVKLRYKITAQPAPQSQPPLWIGLAASQETVATLTDLQILARARNLNQDAARAGEWEIRSADGAKRVARLPYNWPIPAYQFLPDGKRIMGGSEWNGSFTVNEQQLRQVGALADGEYLLAWYVGGARASNVVRFRLNAKYDPKDEPLLKLSEIERGPNGGLPLLVLRAFRHAEGDPAPMASQVAYPTLNIDGQDRTVESIAWAGPDAPLPVGGHRAYILDLGRYTWDPQLRQKVPPIDAGSPHTIIAKVGPQQTPPIRLAYSADLGQAWDKATARLAPLAKPSAMLSGVVTGRDGKPGANYEVMLVDEGSKNILHETADATGRYAFVNIPAGTYEVTATPPGQGQGLTVHKVAIAPGKPVQLDLDLARKFTFSGRVTFPDGKPAANWTVMAFWDSPDGTAEYEDSAETDADGRYAVGSPYEVASFVGWGGDQVKRDVKAGRKDVDFVAEQAVPPPATQPGGPNRAEGDPVEGLLDDGLIIGDPDYVRRMDAVIKAHPKHPRLLELKYRRLGILMGQSLEEGHQRAVIEQCRALAGECLAAGKQDLAYDCQLRIGMILYHHLRDHPAAYAHYREMLGHPSLKGEDLPATARRMELHARLVEAAHSLPQKDEAAIRKYAELAMTLAYLGIEDRQLYQQMYVSYERAGLIYLPLLARAGEFEKLTAIEIPPSQRRLSELRESLSAQAMKEGRTRLPAPSASLTPSASSTGSGQPSSGPSTQPAGGKLEFRIAPSPSGLHKDVVGFYMELLKAGRVGFWWKYMNITGAIPQYAWLPIAGELTNIDRLVTGEYEGKKYVLVSDKPGEVMLPGEGKDAWGLAKVYATMDGAGRPAVGFELDDCGAELFAAFTQANVGNAMAILVDGKVLAAPVLKTSLGKQGMITGQFTEQQVNDLVKALRAGMPARNRPARVSQTQPAAPAGASAIDPTEVRKLFAAIAAGDVGGVRRLLQANPRLVEAREKGRTALHEAAGQERPVRSVLGFRHVGDPSDKFRTSMIDIAALLIANGADTEARDESGAQTPLHLAVTRGSFVGWSGMVESLVKAGADVNARDAQGATPLHLVADAPNFDERRTASYLAIARALIAGGADLLAETNDVCYRPYEIARKSRNVGGKEFYEFLRDKSVPLAKARNKAAADVAVKALEAMSRDDLKSLSTCTAHVPGNAPWPSIIKALREAYADLGDRRAVLWAHDREGFACVYLAKDPSAKKCDFALDLMMFPDGHWRVIDAKIAQRPVPEGDPADTYYSTSFAQLRSGYRAAVFDAAGISVAKVWGERSGMALPRSGRTSQSWNRLADLVLSAETGNLVVSAQEGQWRMVLLLDRVKLWEDPQDLWESRVMVLTSQDSHLRATDGSVEIKRGEKSLVARAEGTTVVIADGAQVIRAAEVRIKMPSLETDILQAGKPPAPAPDALLAPSAGTEPSTQLAADGAFDSFSVQMESVWTCNRTITIQGDGTYTFQMQTMEKVAGEKRLVPSKTPYVAEYRLSPGDVRELTQLLKATQWLALAASPHPVATDTTEYAMTLVRDGQAAERTYHALDKVQAYVDLVRLLHRIVRQEQLLCAVTRRDAPLPGGHDLGEELDGVMGVGSTARPYAPALDYQRLVPAYAGFLVNPRPSPNLAADAAKLMGYLKLESQRGALEALAAGQVPAEPDYAVPNEVRLAAVRALGMMGAGQSLQTLQKVGQDEDHWLREAVAEALLAAPSDKAIPILKEMAEATPNAAWALIRLVRQSEPALLEILYYPLDRSYGDVGAAYHVLRAYHDHWKELSYPPSAAALTAMHDRVEVGTGVSSMAARYATKVLALANDPYVPRDPRQGMEAFLRASQEKQVSRRNLLMSVHFRDNKPPDGFLEDAAAGKLEVKEVLVEGTSAWAHLATEEQSGPHYGVWLSRTGQAWWAKAAWKLAADKVLGNRDGFLRSHPNAKPAEAGKDAASDSSVSRSHQAVSEFVGKLMTAFRDKDMTTLQRLSAGSAIGWISSQEAKDIPSPLPAGLSAPRLEEVVKDLHEKYAENVQFMRDVQPVEVEGDWAAARTTAPHAHGKLDGQALVTVVLQRLPGGWRLVDVGDVKGTLPEDLERRAGALAQLEAALAHRRAVREKPPEKVPAGKGSSGKGSRNEWH